MTPDDSSERQAGRIIAEGTPADVRTDPAVVAIYLGTDERAIARSGEAATAVPVPATIDGDRP